MELSRDSKILTSEAVPRAGALDSESDVQKQDGGEWKESPKNGEAVLCSAISFAHPDQQTETLRATPLEEKKESDSAANKRKRKKSRWGIETLSKKRKSRWGSEQDKVKLPAGTSLLANNLTPLQTELFILRAKLMELNQKLLNPFLYLPPPGQRSPSPPPKYDKQGRRTNTREQRFKEGLLEERDKLMEKITKVNPNFKAPPGWKKRRLDRKILIPQEKHPDYNFIGLIIGPRGNTHRRMEKETGCKISIRGKGSVKEGRGKRQHGFDDENEPLHVFIQGDTKEKIDKAAKIIEKLLIPVEEGANEHKARQLRELAMINGTLREEIICRVCGEAGHKIFECPNRTGAAWTPANVRCEICGAGSHPTSDCPVVGGREEAKKLNEEYESFMSELMGGGSSLGVGGGLLPSSGSVAASKDAASSFSPSVPPAKDGPPRQLEKPLPPRQQGRPYDPALAMGMPQPQYGYMAPPPPNGPLPYMPHMPPPPMWSPPGGAPFGFRGYPPARGPPPGAGGGWQQPPPPPPPPPPPVAPPPPPPPPPSY